MNRSDTTLLLVAALFLGGCGATTEQAQKAVEASYVGKSSDSFFTQYGAPQSSFKLNDGSTLYRWRGGESTLNVPAQYRTVPPSGAGAVETGKSTTITHTSHPDANTTVTHSTTRGFSVGVGLPMAQQVLVAPAQTIKVFCEAEITVDPQGIIRHVHATQDTRGVGLGISRCAEVFNVK